MRAEEKSRYSSWWVVTPTQLNEKDDGGCILHLKKKKVFLFLPDNIGLFPRAHPTSVSLLWGEDEVTNVGQAIRAPCWSSYLGHREIWHLYPPCWLCPHPSYLLHRQEGGSRPLVSPHLRPHEPYTQHQLTNPQMWWGVASAASHWC